MLLHCSHKAINWSNPHLSSISHMWRPGRKVFITLGFLMHRAAGAAASHLPALSLLAYWRRPVAVPASCVSLQSELPYPQAFRRCSILPARIPAPLPAPGLPPPPASSAPTRLHHMLHQFAPEQPGHPFTAEALCVPGFVVGRVFSLIASGGSRLGRCSAGPLVAIEFARELMFPCTEGFSDCRHPRE